MQLGLIAGMDTLAKRVKYARELQRMNQETLAKLSGLKQPDVSKIERGKILRTTGLIGLATALKVRPEWLDTGDGPMQYGGLLGPDPRFQGDPVIAVSGTDQLPDGMIYIRESAVRFSAGNGRTAVFDEINESVPRSYTIDWFVKEGMRPENCRRFKVDGDSMSPFLSDNDKVLVNLAETNVINGKVYALRYGDELRIKRVYRKIDGGLILHSDNPDFRPQDEEITPEIVAQHISIIGRVREKSGTGGL